MSAPLSQQQTATKGSEHRSHGVARVQRFTEVGLVGVRFSPSMKNDNACVLVGGLCPSEYANNVVKGEHNNELIVL